MTRKYHCHNNVHLQLGGDNANSIEAFLASLPDDIQTIQIEHEDIPVFPSLARFSLMTNFRLIGCNTETLPADLGQNTNLCFVDVSNNRLANMPDLRTLTNLIFLNVGYNFLTNLSWMPTQSIVYLDVGRNQIRDMTPLSALTDVRYLNLQHNRIETMPVVNSNHIQTIDLTGNPLCPKLRHVAAENWLIPFHHHHPGNYIVGWDLILTQTPIHHMIRDTNLKFLTHSGDLTTTFYNSIRSSIYYGQLIILQENQTEFHAFYMKLLNRLYSFRRTFYLGKCRRRLRHWLFTRVLEPLMERKYHPDKLAHYIDHHPEILDPMEIAEAAF